MYIGTKEVKDIFLGGLPITAKYLGEHQFYGKANIYGLRWYFNTDTYERTLDAVGLNYAIGIDAQVVFNDFDNAEPWKSITDYTDSFGNKFRKVQPLYFKEIRTATYQETQVSTKPFEGSFLPWCFWDFENSKPVPMALAKHRGFIDNGKMRSIPNVAPSHSYDIVQSRTYAMANGSRYQQLDIHVDYVRKMLMCIEMGTLNPSKIITGYTTGQWLTTHLAVIAESSANRIVIANAFAGQYRVGQTISIGTSQGGNQIFYGRKITAISVYDASNKSISFDGSPVNIAVGNMLYNTASITGFSNNLGSSIGVVTANDGKYSFAYRGWEDPFGGMWQFCDGVNINERQSWICDDARYYASNLFANPYKQLSYANASSNGYASRMGYDVNNPTAQFTTTIGGNDQNNYGDYYWQESGQRIARVGAYWYSGSDSGPWSWFLFWYSSYAHVLAGGLLVLKNPL